MLNKNNNLTRDKFGNQVSVATRNSCYSSSAPEATVYSQNVKTATVVCALENIPIPSTNNITHLACISNTSIFNKPQAYIGTGGVTLYQTLVTNYINSNGVTHSFKVSGDIGTHWMLRVKDVTNTKFYNFGTGLFGSSTADLNGVIGTMVLSNSQVIDTFDITFPSVVVSTEYEVYFQAVSPTIYAADTTPTSTTHKWKINQMANVNFKIQWGNGNGKRGEVGFTSSGTGINNALIISAAAGAVLNNTYPFTIQFSTDQSLSWINARKSGQFTEYNPDNTVEMSDIFVGTHTASGVAYSGNPNVNLQPIHSLSAVASFVNTDNSSIATMTGTITLSQLQLVDKTIWFDPEAFFV
jgi:hypothetical protein